MILLSLAFFGVAWLYGSVGFGGGSAYLSLLVLQGLGHEQLPLVSLTCNILVAGTSFFHYRRRGHFSWPLFWPFMLGSLPFAYWGGRLPIDKKLFLLILGLSLLAAALRLLITVPANTHERKPAFFVQLGIGAVIGFVSGLVGIGGGIFLSPIMLSLGWGKAKEVAAIASAFILVNSLAGLCGQWTKTPDLQWTAYWPLFLPVLVGAQCGSRLGAGIAFSQNKVRLVTAFLSLFASLRILYSFLLF